MCGTLHMGDLIQISGLRPVIHQADVDDLCGSIENESPSFSPATQQRISELVEYYSIDDELNRIAFESLLTALAHPRGRGFLVNGVFGSGKSHLLAVLRLLSCFGECWDFFLRGHPEFSHLRPRFPPRRKLCVVAFSLDAYSGKEHDLEAVFWRETMPHLPPKVQHRMGERGLSRADRFDLFAEALAGERFEGAVWLVDELSTFLASKRFSDLQNDAAFLQYIGQRCESGSFYFVGALQKNVEDIGQFEPYTLEQIKDRYNTRLTLQMAGAQKLVRNRLIGVQDKEALRVKVNEWLAHWQEVFPGFAEGAEDIFEAYPFHPVVFDVLEGVVVRFFSRTRSALLFVHDVISERGMWNSQLKEPDDSAGASPSQDCLQQPAECLITPDTIFDYFRTDILAHPELRRFAEEVYVYYQRESLRLCSQAPDFALRVAKLLILLKIGNLLFSVRQIAQCLLADFRLPRDGNYGFVQHVLERFRTQGNFVAVHRRGGNFEDVYFIDLGIRINEAVRRRVDSVLEGMTADDRRIEQYALQCCTSEEFPLARLVRPAAFPVWWENTERKMLVQWMNLLSLTTPSLANWASVLSEPASREDGALFVASLFRPQRQKEHWINSLREVKPSRWKCALACLLPRKLTRDELARLREYAASHLLTEDPSLKDNRRGRGILARLREDLPAQVHETQNLLRDLYFRGELLIGHEIHCRTDELVASDQSWLFLLDAIAAHVFPQVFPLFPPMAPEHRLLSSTASNGLAAEMLRDGIPGNLLTPSMERAGRSLGAPLGLLHATRKGLRFEKVPEILVRMCEECMTHSSSYSAVERLSSKSEAGLPAELTQLVIASMLRQGRLVALDETGSLIPPDLLHPPLSESVVSVRRGSLLSESEWTQLAMDLSFGMPPVEMRPRTFENQEKIWTQFCRWREEIAQTCETADTILNDLVRALAQPATQWTQTRSALSAARRWIDGIRVEQPASEGLRAWMRVPQADKTSPATHAEFTYRVSFLHDHASTLMQMHRYLSGARLPAEHALVQKRERLLSALRSGEKMMEHWESLRGDWEDFHNEYRACYAAWHVEQNAPTRVAIYLQLRETREFEGFHGLGGIVLFAGEMSPDHVGEAVARFCDYPTLPAALMDSPCCPQCRHPLGETVKPPSPEAIRDMYRKAAQERFIRLCQPQVVGALTQYIERSQGKRVSLLSGVVDALRAADEERFFSHLSQETLKEINLALSPRKRVRRQTSGIMGTFAGQSMTKRNAVTRFESWLDGDEGLRPEDVIDFE